MVPYYYSVVELSRRLTDWACNSGIKLAKGRTLSGVNRAAHPHVSTAGGERHVQSAVVCTGGGPGFMEAANKGASLVPGAVSIGVKGLVYIFLYRGNHAVDFCVDGNFPPL